ncbi:MAG: hypothetical protein JWO07_294 [Candidatus Saccharibacteria bacterium]|nr:hypothetical protein [Candidatus Saccharibacteria bacterium]
MKTDLKLTAPILRIVLMTTIGLLILASSVGFWFVHNQLTEFATEVSSDNVSVASSVQDVAKLQQLKSEMDKNPVAIARAKSIVADTKLYQYQNQIIDDLTSYANAAGFPIVTFTFANNDPTSKTGATGTAPATASATAAAGAAPIPSGLKATLATISFPKDVNYSAYMHFLKSIELNLTKMEITGVSMQLDQDTGQLSPNALTIEVYTR